ncbi:hypothetical protein E3N88_32645 [Mikania micrantha]|uniref:Reverse transcriptase Ty1/copia-type domain-containing protein n=1 Tax=Mikania micrantha TaxID=192012 RepID=A0A5N6M8Z3_9ASTR|nr:hypothetical protein E3N88_32645 [Mikania micrantha]
MSNDLRSWFVTSQTNAGMQNNKDQDGKDSRKRPYEYELTEEDKQRIRDMVEQVHAQEPKRLRPSTSRGPWDWYPTTLAVWAREERVPKLPLLGDASTGPPLPPIGMPMERAFAALISRYRRESCQLRVMTDGFTDLLEHNQQLQSRVEQLEERLAHIEGAQDDVVARTQDVIQRQEEVAADVMDIRDKTTLLEEQQDFLAAVTHGHDGRLAAVEAEWLPSTISLSPATFIRHSPFVPPETPAIRPPRCSFATQQPPFEPAVHSPVMYFIRAWAIRQTLHSATPYSTAIQKKRTWELVTLPPDGISVGVKWLFKTKLGTNGCILKHKARLVAKWYSQQPGIDFQETFAPVASFETIRLVISVVAQRGWNIHQLDAKSAFLNDDFICVASCVSLINEFKEGMKETFEITDLGLLQMFLDLEVVQTEDGILLHQKTYAQSLLSKFHTSTDKVESTPMNYNEKLCVNNDSDATNGLTQEGMKKSDSAVTCTNAQDYMKLI